MNATFDKTAKIVYSVKITFFLGLHIMDHCLANFPEGDTFIDEHVEFMVPYDEGTINVYNCLFSLPKPLLKICVTSLLLYLVAV